MTKARIVLIPLLMASVTIAQAQKVTIKLNPPAGKTYTYSLVSKNTGKGAFASNMTQTSTVTTKVISNKGGQITLSSKVSNVKITVPPNSPMKGSVAQMEKMMAGQEQKVVLNSRGMPTGPESDSALMAAMMGQGAAMNFLPASPVGVGSTWTHMLDLSKMAGSMPGSSITGGKVPVQMKLMAFENRGGARVAKIQTSMKGSMTMTLGTQGKTSITMSSTGTSWIDVKTGMTVEMTSTSNTSTNFSGQTMTNTAEVTMKLK